jgi:cystathionine beta-synthase
MDFSLVDDYVRVTDKEAMQMTRRLAREEGLFVGQSCGMAMAGTLDWLRAHRHELTGEDVVVVLLPDSGFRYLAKTYNDEWMRRHGFLDEAAMTIRDVLAVRRRDSEIVAVAPETTLAEAVAMMTEHGISQVPVFDGERHLVGSLTERHILSRLVEEPESRTKPVAEVMAPPLPIVEADIDVEGLSTYLDNEAGAVLVKGTDNAYQIVTRSDLIGALAHAGRNRNGSTN